MLVILRENVKNLGLTGDVVQVKDGYARNYLLPRKLVEVADPQKVTQLEHYKRVLEKKRQRERAKLTEFADRFKGVSLKFERKAGRKEKMFGSVSANDISAKLSEMGLEIDKNVLQLKDTLKTFGTHTVALKFQNDVSAQVTIVIDPEGGKFEADEEASDSKATRAKGKKAKPAKAEKAAKSDKSE